MENTEIELKLNPVELEYLSALVGNTSYDDFSERYSRYVQLDFLTVIRKTSAADKLYDKLIRASENCNECK